MLIVVYVFFWLKCSSDFMSTRRLCLRKILTGLLFMVFYLLLDHRQGWSTTFSTIVNFQYLSVDKKEQGKGEDRLKKNASEQNEELIKLYNSSLNTPLKSMRGPKFKACFLEETGWEGQGLISLLKLNFQCRH